MQSVHYGAFISNVGAPRKINRAEPETFIHIFVHKKDELIEFLEHMTKVNRKTRELKIEGCHVKKW